MPLHPPENWTKRKIGPITCFKKNLKGATAVQRVLGFRGRKKGMRRDSRKEGEDTDHLDEWDLTLH